MANIKPYTAKDVAKVHEIKRRVCSTFDITLKEMDGMNKANKFSFPRMIAMYLSIENTKIASKKIDPLFNKKPGACQRAKVNILRWRKNSDLKRFILQFLETQKASNSPHAMDIE